jgi:hypothetical protein
MRLSALTCSTHSIPGERLAEDEDSVCPSHGA